MVRITPEEVSYWQDTSPKVTYPKLQKGLEVDVAIVGGGIIGLSTAYLLKQAGLKVAVVEKTKIGGGTTGRTTGKVTSQHNLIYQSLAESLGQETAKLYGQANQYAPIYSPIRSSPIKAIPKVAAQHPGNALEIARVS